jgi:G3E family GTPase
VKTPLTIVGGFLGAGKTTLVNHLLREGGGRRLAVLVNDFGAINIDAELIESRGGGVARLSNGCLCCTIGDSLADALAAVLRQPARPGHIVIEASGVADPGRIAEIAYLDPAFALSGIVVVADAERLSALAIDKYVGDTVSRQIAVADLIVLNKIDLCGDNERAAASACLRQHGRQPRIFPAVQARLPLEVVLGLDEAHWGAFLRGEAPAHRPDRTFASFVFESDRAFHAPALRQLLDDLPATVLRAKGLVRTDEQTGLSILHVVGPRWQLTPSERDPADRRTRLVVIGLAEGMDACELRERFSAALAAG